MKWKVIEQKGGTICALGGPDATWNRPGAEERLLWEGEARDNSEALREAGKVVPIELGPYGHRLKKGG
jgi:hypothetical protein